MYANAAVLLALLVAAPIQAQGLYKCTDASGKTTYSQTQCAADAVPVVVQVAAPTPEQARITAARMASDRAWIEEGVARRQARVDENRRQQRFADLDRAHAEQVASIDARRRRTSNNFAGATLENALAADLANVNAQYNADLDRLRGAR